MLSTIYLKYASIQISPNKIDKKLSEFKLPLPTIKFDWSVLLSTKYGIKMFIRQTQYEPKYEFKYASETTADIKRQKKYINENTTAN